MPRRPLTGFTTLNCLYYDIYSISNLLLFYCATRCYFGKPGRGPDPSAEAISVSSSASRRAQLARVEKRQASH